MALYWTVGLETAALGIAMAFLTPTEFRHMGLNWLPPNGDGCVRQGLFMEAIRRAGARPSAPTYCVIA